MGSGVFLEAEDPCVGTETQTNGGEVPVLELKNLSKSFGGLQATRNSAKPEQLKVNDEIKSNFLGI